MPLRPAWERRKKSYSMGWQTPESITRPREKWVGGWVGKWMGKWVGG